MAILSSDEQLRAKNSYASAPALGITLMCNGEQKTRLIDQQGNLQIAGIEAPTVAPTFVGSDAGNLTASKVVAYRYVYAATERYPLVENTTPANGSIAPRSNPSPSVTHNYTSETGARKITLSVTSSPRSDVNEIWLYRTGYYTTEEEASTAAEAGLCFYVGKISNDQAVETLTITDNTKTASDQIELDNQVAPTAQYSFYYPPFFYLFGNNPLEAKVTLVEGYKIEIVSNTEWFNGRDRQHVRLTNISTGGIDANGTYYIKITGKLSAELYSDYDLTVPATIPYTGTTYARVYGQAATLWRSKPKNPLAWGETVIIGTARLPRFWNFNLGAGEGTGITNIPGTPFLKLDVRNPNQSYVLNLKAAERESFTSSLRPLSEQYAVSSHFAQFPATLQDGNSVLWGIDCTKFAILQTDGATQNPVADPIPDILRNMIRDADGQKQFHGIRDAYHELNCLWVESQDSTGSIDLMIYNHWPSGQWGIHQENDLRCTAIVQNTLTNEQLILGGTDSGLLGQILKPETTSNWIEDPLILYLNQIIFTQQSVTLLGFSSTALNVHGTFFFINIGNTKYCIYFDVGSTGTVQPSASADYFVPVNLPSSYNKDTFSETVVAAWNSVSNPGFSLVTAFTVDDDAETSYDVKFAVNELGTAYEDLYSEGTFATEVTDIASHIATATFINLDSSTPDLGATNLSGTWIMIEMDNDQQSYIWGRISSSVGAAVSLDRIYNKANFNIAGGFFTPEIATVKAYVGLTHCQLLKFFDLQKSNKQKYLHEVSITAENVDPDGTFKFGFHQNLNETPSQWLSPSPLEAPDISRSYQITNQQLDCGPYRAAGITLDERGFDELQIQAVTLHISGAE